MLPQLSVLRRLPRLAEPTKRWKSRSKKGSVAPRAQDSRQSQVEPEIGQTTLDILRAMLREARSEDGSVNSSLEKGSVARSAPTEGPHHELGAVMKTPRSEVSYFPSISHRRMTLSTRLLKRRRTPRVILQPKLLLQGPFASTKDLAVRADGRMYGRTGRRQRTLKLIALLSPPNRIARLKRPPTVRRKSHTIVGSINRRRSCEMKPSELRLRRKSCRSSAAERNVHKAVYQFLGSRMKTSVLHVSGGLCSMYHLPIQVRQGQ
ncbi:hypothetical protein DFH06DRAFT_1243189 [Mycena polygramma]|nr:hypothetical protein DFH06DRAFT_1243189 [Mycena polygramma]